MRRTLLLFAVFALAISSATGMHASTDCERWLADYKKSLDHNASVQRAMAAKHRAHALARRVVGQLARSAPAAKPPLTRISSTRPRLTPKQMLSKFDVLCGELPVSPTDQVLDSRMSPDEFISELSLGGPVEVETTPAEGLLASSDVPPSFVSSTSVPQSSGAGAPAWPIYGPLTGGGGSVPTGNVVTPTGPTGATTPTTPVTPITPVVPVTPIAPVAPIPEPSSLVLLLTGGSGAFALARRRLVRS